MWRFRLLGLLSSFYGNAPLALADLNPYFPGDEDTSQEFNEELLVDSDRRLNAGLASGREVVKPPFPPFGKPDLTVLDVTRPVRVGNAYTVTVTIGNLGNVAASSFFVVLRDNNTGMGHNKQLGSLPGGQRARLSFAIQGPEESPNYYVSAIVDYGNKVAESNEQNNVKNNYGPW